MSESDIKGVVEFTGGDKSAEEINKVSKATETLTKETEKSAKATNTATNATKASTPNIGQFGSAVGLAGQAVSKLSPALGSVVTMAGSATGAIQSLTTMGLEPMGIALGVVSIAIGAGTALYNSYNASQEAAAIAAKKLVDEALKNARAIDTVSQAIKDQIAIIDANIARAQEQEKLENDRANLRQGNLSVERQLEAERLAAAELADARAALAAADRSNENRQQVEDVGEMSRAERLRNSVARTQTIDIEQAVLRVKKAEEELAVAARARGYAQQNANIDAMPTGADAPTDPDFMDPNRRAREAAARAARAERERAAAAAAAKAALLLQIANEYEAEQTRIAQKGIDERAASLAGFNREEVRFKIEHTKQLHDLELKAINNRLAEGKRLHNIEIARAKEKEDTIKSVEESISNAVKLGGEVATLAAGSSSKAQKIVTQVMAGAAMTEAIIKGALEVAEAAASFAIPFGAGVPQGIAHSLAAASYAVAATKAGIAAGGGAGGGGGASGGSAPSAPATSRVGGGPAGDSSGGSKGGDTIIINMASNGMIYAADQNQLYRDIDRGIRNATGRLARV